MPVTSPEQETKRAKQRGGSVSSDRRAWRHISFFPNSCFRYELLRQYYFATIIFRNCFVLELQLRETVAFLIGIYLPLADVPLKGLGDSCERLRKPSLSRKEGKHNVKPQKFLWSLKAANLFNESSVWRLKSMGNILLLHQYCNFKCLRCQMT